MATSPESPKPPPAPHGGHHLLSDLADLHPMALLQPWIDYVPQQQRRLGLFICLALAIHAAICLFLTIDTSVAQMRHESRLYVSVASPQALAVNGPSSDLLWDRLTDPRVFLLPMTSPADLALDLPPPAADAAFDASALPQPAPPETYHAAQPAASPLDQQVAEAMNPPRQPFVYDQAPTPMATKTTWQWDGALARRHPAGAPDLPSPVSDTDLCPTKLRVAVNGYGAVEHVLVDQGSGELGASIAKDLDRQAVDAARKIRFDPVTAPGVQWGRITIFWHYAAKPQEEVVPTPPAAGQ
jgi:outer membrane biosynthesis protein TonB